MGCKPISRWLPAAQRGLHTEEDILCYLAAVTAVLLPASNNPSGDDAKVDAEVGGQSVAGGAGYTCYLAAVTAVLLPASNTPSGDDAQVDSEVGGQSVAGGAPAVPWRFPDGAGCRASL